MTTLRLLTRATRIASWTYQHHAKLSCGNNVQNGLLLLNTGTREYVKFAPIVATRHTFSTKKSPDLSGKANTKAPTDLADDEIFGNTSKLGLFSRFKLMYKKYWYVLIPVHVVTSIGWFGGFYYMSQSGVDIPAILEHLHISESIMARFQNSSMGHFAIAYLCFKVATPLRYALTLGGTTVSIKYLVQAGHIKPMPSKQEFLQMYEQKKADRAKVEEADKKSKTKQSK